LEAETESIEIALPFAGAHAVAIVGLLVASPDAVIETLVDPALKLNKRIRLLLSGRGHRIFDLAAL
jgi:hypothetical protein